MDVLKGGEYNLSRRNLLNPTNLSSRRFGLLITEVCHFGMWNVNMHQISCGALNYGKKNLRCFRPFRA